MKSAFSDIARALIDLAAELPASEHAALCDAALEALKKGGATTSDVRKFIRLAKAELKKRDPSVHVTMMTPTGQSGEHRISMTKTLESSLKKQVELEEHANANLIGGATISYSDERFDASLKGALERLQSQLTAA